MADDKTPSIEIEGDSEPAVALALLKIIMAADGEGGTRDRDWILSTYADCLAVVGGAEVEYDEEDDEDEDDEEEDEEDEAKPAAPARRG